jgi:hypothetical protein
MHLNSELLARLLAVMIGLAPAGFAPGVMADTATRIVGNSDGTPFKIACPPGEALAGWGYNATDRLTAIGMICQKIADSDDGKILVGAPPPSANFKGAQMPGEAAGDDLVCPDTGGIIRSLQVFLTANLQVHSIRGVCKAPHKAPSQIRPTTTNGGPSTAKSSVSCDTRTSYATGFVGTFKPSLSSGGILSLGLLCFDGKSDEADNDDKTAPPPDNNAAPPPDTDNDTTPPDNGDNNAPVTFEINIDANGITFGPKGKVRLTNDTTTLYADKGKTEIDYFEKGQKVVVTGCEDKGRGWCEVIKPKRGLIWGGDLK